MHESKLMHSSVTFPIFMPPRLTPAQSEPQTAGIRVSVPTPLRDCSAGAAEIAVSSKNLRNVLEELERRFPKLHRSICDETGTLRRHINLFVNTEHMRDCNGLDTAVEPGDIITIMTAVSGG